MAQIHSTQAIREIAGLKYHPGFLLLLDQLQARFDDLSEDLAEPALSTDEAHNKLRYWQAFREILNTLKTTPANYLIQLEGEPKEEEPVLPDNYWQQMAAQNYLKLDTFPDSLE